MQINSINNSTNFGARIKINKVSKACYRDAALLSSSGTTASGIGVSSCLPAFDPAHHVATAAKVVDGAFAIIGTGLAFVSGALFKLSHSIFKNGIKAGKM